MLDILIFIIVVVVVAFVIIKVVEMFLPEIHTVARLIVGGVALILILKKLWPLLAHAGLS